MHKSTRFGRTVALGLVGGCLFQVVGCASGILPVILSFGESAVLSLLANLFTLP